MGVTVVLDYLRGLHDAVNEQLRKVDPLFLVLGCIGGAIVVVRVRRVLSRSEKALRKRLFAYAFSHLRRLPFVKRRIEEQLGPAKKDILLSIHKDDDDRVFITELPRSGFSSEEVFSLAEKYNGYGKFDVARGMVSGTVYTDRSEQHIDLLTRIYTRYAYSNPLHPDVFPGVRKMEAEVIRMVLNLYNAPAASSGSLTSGGTESIIMACFAYRNLAHSKGIENPVILCPITAHAAFDKAAHLCGMRIRHVPVDSSNRADLRAMKSMISSDVCVLVGSAPNYPTGTIDPIEEISKLGLAYGIPVHVDACLGGFLIPFMESAGVSVPLFDFRLPGVTSVSCDTHKYGCTPKGSSIVMYRTLDLHHHQFFSCVEWVGGIYATPTISGSRAGSNAASAWATLLYFGRDEYIRRCGCIVKAARRLAKEAASIEGLEVFGSVDVSVVAFRSHSFNIYAVGDRLHKKGYNLNSLQNPDAIHVCLTYNHTSDESITTFLKDLQEACAEVSQLPDKGNSSKSAALYGMAAQIPDKSLVDEMAFAYLDACYAEPPKLE